MFAFVYLFGGMDHGLAVSKAWKWPWLAVRGLVGFVCEKLRG